MGQRNTPHNSHMIDFEADQQGQHHILPDPCVFYGNLPTFPQPNVHTVVPVSGNAGNTYLHPLPEQHENPLFYGMTHYNGTIHQCPATNLDIAMATSSNHYNPYVAAPATREFPTPVIHGAHDHLPFTTAQGVVGIHTDGYGRNIPYADGVRGLFKRKNAEGIPMNFQYHHSMVGSSSAVAPVIARVHEADTPLVDVASRIPPDYVDSSLLTEDVSQRSLRNRSGVSAQETITAHSSNRFIQGSYVGQAFPLPPANPWLDMQLNGNQAALLPYVHGSMGGCVETGNMGIQGYQGTANNRSLSSYMHPPIAQGFPSVHHHPQSIQGMGGHNINFPPQMASSSSRRLVTNGPSSSSISPFPGVVEAGPRYMGPFPPTGFRLYRPHRRDFVVDTNIARNRNIPNMRVLPEDGVAILEIPEYNEVGDSIDQHRDMRLDIDHMSYEELLALGEQIGCVTTGLSEEVIISLLKTRSFTSSNPYSTECLDQETDFCVICQNDYKDQEKIGIVSCGHEYHVDCIKKWLVVKNSCPICKSTAVTPGKTEL
ncbi:PREDICTED: uncharacterized protein LOC109163656 isoform X1 [Ipomoea nil]|uniref:uncharacterized protein LOC109163656 isoform X1 n=1 Tax=Ipomoea nil TaxID=35883 RepID=UPI000901CA9E|nr:PREDICTED: uncharacterized protein LOC109163656 isoform X1 [Ipomoea nil]XP_019167953.1 PREDICTED: uncharacterized protein LOC109163656 isoform X1 [Ipomoea nil]